MIDTIHKTWPVIVFGLGLCIAIGRQNQVLAATVKKTDANCGAITKLAAKTAHDLNAELYSNKGVSTYTPREMCKECRVDCERRMQVKHDEIVIEIRGLGKKIDKRNDDDQSYRIDMIKQVAKASGMIEKESGATVNQVGGAVDYDRIIDGVVDKLKGS